MAMIDSVDRTIVKEQTDLIILLDKDDDQLKNYINKFPNWVKFEIFDKTKLVTKTTEIINLTFDKYKDDYRFFSVTNDDIEYSTYAWDLILSNKLRISTGFEPNMLNKHGRKTLGFPVISVIDADICKKLGWLQFPGISHCGGDNVWWWIGKRLKILYFDPCVVFIHRNPFICNEERDDTFLRINNGEAIKKDSDVVKNWVKYSIKDDLNKLKTLSKEFCYV